MNKDKKTKSLERLIENIVKKEMNKLNEDGIFMQDPLFRTFVEPFTDVVDTAKAELTKLSAVTQENVKKLAKQTVYLALPFVSSYAIARAEKSAKDAISKKIKQVNNDYKDVYQRTWNALRNRDVLGFTFLLGPLLPLGDASRGFAIALKMLKDSTGSALGALSMISGGSSTFADWDRRYRAAIAPYVPSYGSGYGGGGGIGGYGDYWGDFGGDFGGFGESIELTEQQQQQQQTDDAKQKLDQIQRKFAKELQTIASDPAFQAAAAKSPIAKDFQSAAFEAITNTLKPVLSANNYESLKRAVGPEFSKIESEVKKAIPEETMTPELKKQFEDEFVKEFKELYKSLIINQIKSSSTPATEKIIAKLVTQIKNS